MTDPNREAGNTGGLDDDAFAAGLRDLLRSSESGIDYVRAARLSAARARAVSHLEQPARSRWWTWTVPGSAIGASLLVWLLLPRLGIGPSANPAASVTQAEVIETLSDDKVPAVSEDLEFYQWLADSNSAG